MIELWRNLPNGFLSNYFFKLADSDVHYRFETLLHDACVFTTLLDFLLKEKNVSEELFLSTKHSASTLC